MSASLFRRVSIQSRANLRYAAATPPPTTGGYRKDELDLSFSDPEAAFKSKTTYELARALIVYQMCSINFIVENNKQLMKRMRQVTGQKMFNLLMKATFYGQFVAGEDQEKIRPTIERLSSFGVKSILDYSVEEDISQEEAEKREVSASISETGDSTEEGSLKQFHMDKSFADRRYKVKSARTYFYLNEATCEKNMEAFLRSAEAVAGTTSGTGLMAIKMTALGRPQLLLQLSEVIMRARNYMQQIAGGSGNVLTHHKTIEDLQRYFGGNVSSKPEVQGFMKKITSDKEGIVHLFPWSLILDEHMGLSDTFRVPDPKTGQMRRLISQIAPKEEEMFRNMLRRLNHIIQAAKDMDVRMMIDAEQTYFQPAISRMTLEMQSKYNKEKCYVFNTYQTYLKATHTEICTDLEQAKRQNFYWGAKLVRGAYIEQERARAAAMGYEDPTNENYEATSASFHRCLTEVLSRIKVSMSSGSVDKDLIKERKPDEYPQALQSPCLGKITRAKSNIQYANYATIANVEPSSYLEMAMERKDRIGIMVASHNEDTVRFAIQSMKEMGITPEDKVICFGQLLGMCDHVTFPLGQSGYSAYKYVPYGPVEEVLPYLSRRADENRGFLAKIKKEKKLLRTEIFRRLRNGKLAYVPVGNYKPI